MANITITTIQQAQSQTASSTANFNDLNTQITNFLDNTIGTPSRMRFTSTTSSISTDNQLDKAICFIIEE